MRIAVIGAGLPGITTACFLAQAGHEVQVLDRRAGPGLETSFANGGMLTPSQAAPWNTPGIALQILRWIGREDSPFLLKLTQLPSLVGWGTAFLRHSAVQQFRSNQLKNAALALYSLQQLRNIREQLGIQYDQSTRGTMKIYRTAAALDEALAMLQASGMTPLSWQPLDQSGVIRQEPALSPVRDKLAGGIYFPQDEAGDAYLYCREIAAAAAKGGAGSKRGSATV
jgi:D-amino-acid dehydrogenase